LLAAAAAAASASSKIVGVRSPLVLEIVDDHKLFGDEEGYMSAQVQGGREETIRGKNQIEKKERRKEGYLDGWRAKWA
jgi:hypothetical protein